MSHLYPVVGFSARLRQIKSPNLTGRDLPSSVWLIAILAIFVFPGTNVSRSRLEVVQDERTFV
jgi:hypothetical protein